MKCVPGEKLIAMAAAVTVALSRGQDANEILAWSDFFGIVTAGLIAIANRKLYITDPNSDCCKKPKQPNKTKEIRGAVGGT